MIQFKIVLWMLLTHNLSKVKSNVIPILEQLIVNQNVPLQVVLRTCWSSEEELYLHKLFDKSGRISFGRAFDSSIHRTVIVKDLACQNDLFEAEKDRSEIQWIYFNSKDELNSTEFMNILTSKDLTVASKVQAVNMSADGYEIKSFFRYSVNSPLIEEIIGNWQNDKMQLINLSRNLNSGVTLIAAIVCNSSADQSATKVNVELTKQLAFLLNVTISFECFEDWDSARQADHVDLIVTPTYMTTERLAQIHFLAMTGPLDYKFIFRSPKLSYTDNVFAVAFHSRVWLSILCIILLATVLQVIIIRVDRAVVHTGDPHRDRGIAGVLLSMISLASQQEVLIASRTLSSRTLSVVMLFSLMFLYISFSANIVGLIQSPSRRIRTLGDLRGSGMELTVQDDRINRIFIGNQSNDRAFVPLTEGADRIREGLYAFHGDTNLIYRFMVDYYKEEEKCNLQAINQLIPLNGYYSIAKNSPFAEYIKVGLLALRERGFQARETEAHYTRKPPCLGDSVFDPIAMVDALFAMQLMGWAVGLAPVILALELAEKRYGVLRRAWVKGKKSLSDVFETGKQVKK